MVCIIFKIVRLGVHLQILLPSSSRRTIRSVFFVISSVFIIFYLSGDWNAAPPKPKKWGRQQGGNADHVLPTETRLIVGKFETPNWVHLIEGIRASSLPFCYSASVGPDTSPQNDSDHFKSVKQVLGAGRYHRARMKKMIVVGFNETQRRRYFELNRIRVGQSWRRAWRTTMIEWEENE